MPPTIGTVLNSPGPNFAFNRGYVKYLAVLAGGWPVTWDGELLSIAVGTPLTYTNFIRFEPQFAPWSSNTYTLRWIVRELYYVVPGHSPSPATWGVDWFPNTPPPYPTALQLNPIATGLPYAWVELPPAPADYWAG